MDVNETRAIVAWIREIFKSRNFETLYITFPDQYDCSGGYLAVITYVNVTVEKSGLKETLELVIKSATSEAISSYSHEVYANEVMVYADLIPYLNQFAATRKATPVTNLPYCYGTLTGKDYYVIVLENLKYKGFKLFDLENPCDTAHTKLILKAYARWHARFIAVKDQDCGLFDKFHKLTQGVKNSPLIEYGVNMFIEELDYVINLYKERNQPRMMEKLNGLKNNVGDLVHDSMNNENDNFCAIVHGDCWINNLLFHYDENSKIPDDVVIIDWQCAFVGPPMVDVTHILFCNCSRAELENLDDLLHLYYTTLSETLLELGSDPDKCFPWNVCLESFKQYAPIGIVAMATSAKISFTKKPSKTPNFADIKENKNFSAAVGTELSDPEGFFDRVDGILQLAIEKEYI